MFSGRRGEQASSPGWGGDEFAVLCPADAEHDPAAMAMRMIEQIRLPYQLNQTGFFVTTSIGIAIYSEYGLTASELLRNADKAMYEVKKDARTPASSIPRHSTPICRRRSSWRMICVKRWPAKSWSFITSLKIR